jgi:hypothetical protein
MKKTTKTTARKTKSSTIATTWATADRQTFRDIKTATFITSGLANLFVLIGWVVLNSAY